MAFTPSIGKKVEAQTTSTQGGGFAPALGKKLAVDAASRGGAFAALGNETKPEPGFFRSLFDTVVKPIAEFPIQATRATIAGVAGLTGHEDTEAQYSRPIEVPLLGTVKGLSANPEDIKRYGTQSPKETLAQAANVGAAAVGGGAVRAGLKGAVTQGAVQGLKTGVLSGAASSLANDGSVSDVVSSAVTGGVIGGLTGGALPLAGKGVVKLIGKTNTLVKDLKNGAVREALSGIDTHTLNVLDPTKAVPEQVLEKLTSEGRKVVGPETQQSIQSSYNTYLKQAKRAANDASIETPLELAGKKAGSALEIFNQKLAKQGSLKQAALEEAGNKTINTDAVKNSLREGLQKIVGAEVVPKVNELGVVEGYVLQNAPGKVSKISLDPADQKLVRDVYALLDNLDSEDTVFRADGTVDAIQDILYKRKAMVAVPVNGPTESVLKKAIGELNSSVKRVAGEGYTKANDKYAYLVDFRDKLNKALGQEGSKGGSLMKRVFSPTDGGTKGLFKQVKNLTGIDLVREATLAKQAMEIAGDTRQRGLLESLQLLRSVPTSPSGLIDRTLSYGLEKAQQKVANKGEVIQSALERASKRAAQ